MSTTAFIAVILLSATVASFIQRVTGFGFAMQGPPAVLYFIACTDTKEEYLAITQAFFMFGNLMMTGFRAANGFVTQTVGIGWCCGLAGVLIGIWLGEKVFDRMPLAVLRKVVYAYMAISGVAALMA